MSTKSKAYLLGGGIGSLAAAAFMIRDGGIPGENISILEAAPVMGGSLDGAGDHAVGYSLRGGRMLTTDMWATTFAFQPWHSAVEFKRYLHRFMLEFSRIETLAGVKRTIYNQYDSLVLPLQTWLEAQGVRLVTDCKVTDLEYKTEGGKFSVTGIHCLRHTKNEKDSDQSI